jgi:thioesterase domain-containing protein
MTQPATISEARRQLLEKFRRGELQTSNGALEPLIARPPGELAPLAPGLEQLWFRDQLSRGAPINNESFTIHKQGPLDPAVLERCFNEIARRHEIWRSAFPIIDGKVVQRVDSNVRVSLPCVDLSHLPVEEREAEAVRIGTEDARRPFDVNVAPLFRVRLVRCAELYHRIYLTVHRLVFDCVSVERVFIVELAALYEAYSAGQPSPLPELAFQYSDYAAWKQRQNTGPSHAAQLEYWRQNLSGDLPPCALPSVRPRSSELTCRSGMETCTIPAPLTEAVRGLAQREGVTPFMILLAAFQVLLYRYTGEDEIIVGGKTNARTRPEFESLLGSFVETVVFRSLISAELSFLDFLGRVKNTVLGALAHSEISFDDIVRELAPKRDSSRHPLFQILFSTRAPFGNFPNGWNLTDMEVHSGASGFELFVEFSEFPKSLTGRFVYSTDLLDRATIQRLRGNFLALLEEVVSNPDQTVSQVPLSWPHTRIHKMLEAQAEAKPDRVEPGEIEATLLQNSGELDTKALPAPELATPPQREFVPPQDEIEERLANLWQEVLSVHPISVTDNYFDLGGHSLLALRLFSEIKFCFQLDLPLATLFYAPTVRSMAGVIRDSGVQATAPIVPIQTNGTKPAIFCIGALNGEVILFRRLALELGPDQPLYGLQPFSLVDHLATVETLAASYIEQLRQFGEPRPFCLLGYSFGGLVAAEMAHQLRKAGAEPPILLLIDAAYLEGCKASEPWRDRIRRYRYHLDHVIYGAAGLHHLLDRLRSRCFRVIHKVSTKLGVAVPKIASDIRGRQLLAAESYRAKPYPGRVCLFKAESRPEFFDADPDLGWGGFLSDLRVEDVPGDHGTINTGMNLKILARKLTAALPPVR